MPQIWMTYDELAGLLDCGVLEARERVQREGLDRRKSRDGNIRIKLSFPMIAMFVAKIKGEVMPVDRVIEDLRQVHAKMVSYEGGALQDQRSDDSSAPRAALAG